MNKIKSERIRLGLTQKQLSEIIGVPQRTIENWEGGQRKCPDYVEKMILDKLNESERGQGEWVHQDNAFYCSVCGELACSDECEWHLGRYCPNCGAKMDK